MIISHDIHNGGSAIEFSMLHIMEKLIVWMDFQGLTKQSGLDDSYENGTEDEIGPEIDQMRGGSDDDLPPTPPRPSTPAPAKGLPWAPKVR